MWAGRPSCGLAVGAAGGAGLADLLQEFAVGRELQDLVVVLAVAGEPDVALFVDVNAVLALRPVVAGPGAAPALQQAAIGGEVQHRRRRLAAAGFGRVLLRALFVVDQRRGPVDDPDAVVVVDGDAGHLPEDPIARQRFGPERLDHILWWGGLLRFHLNAAEQAEGKGGG